MIDAHTASISVAGKEDTAGDSDLHPFQTVLISDFVRGNVLSPFMLVATMMLLACWFWSFFLLYFESAQSGIVPKDIRSELSSTASYVPRLTLAPSFLWSRAWGDPASLLPRFWSDECGGCQKSLLECAPSGCPTLYLNGSLSTYFGSLLYDHYDRFLLDNRSVSVRVEEWQEYPETAKPIELNASDQVVKDMLAPSVHCAQLRPDGEGMVVWQGRPELRNPLTYNLNTFGGGLVFFNISFLFATPGLSAVYLLTLRFVIVWCRCDYAGIFSES